MAVARSWRYRSRLGSHSYTCWRPESGAMDKPPQPPTAPSEALCLSLDPAQFKTDLARPACGRFYPARILNLAQPAPAAVFRLRSWDAHRFRADFNPALAGHAVEVGDAIVVDEAAVTVPDSVMLDAGMEMPLADTDTDYNEAQAFARADEDTDAAFYAQPRPLLHIDGICAARCRAFYQAQLPTGGAVLDLMAGWRSHLPPGLHRVSGLGMNAAEMADNPQLDETRVHDLNDDPHLPYADGQFDAVVNSVSFEYLTRPAAVLREVRRVLRPGGRLLITASQRYFPPKAIRLWTLLHPMERLGWLVWQLHSAGFTHLHTQVERGLRRAADDRYADQLTEMDPLYAVWGEN